MKKTGRYPNISARNPPINGPIKVPEIVPVERNPSAQPLLFCGACEATSAVALGMYPDKSPLSARKRTS